jgi:hypothetical protein
MIVPLVTRAEGDPKLCPVLSTVHIIGVERGKLDPSKINAITPCLVQIACVGGSCEVWDEKVGRCGLRRVTRAVIGCHHPNPPKHPPKPGDEDYEDDPRSNEDLAKERADVTDAIRRGEDPFTGAGT